MTNVHVTNNQTLMLEDTVVNQKGFKPVGLWIAEEGVWEECCEREGMEVGNCKYEVEVDEDEVGILKIEKRIDALFFMRDYCEEMGPLKMVEWNKVVCIYDGIELDVDSEGYKCLEEHGLYLAWDVKSTCIWRVSIGVTIKKIE